MTDIYHRGVRIPQEVPESLFPGCLHWGALEGGEFLKFSEAGDVLHVVPQLLAVSFIGGF